ncbi:MAG: hypothetical protein KY461_10465, partial [Actinobacteria bacterium]|nr:hypothetical protein [Actinomycetota bacterium]
MAVSEVPLPRGNPTVPLTRGSERTMAEAAVRVGVVAAVPVVVAALALRGAAGALTALGAVLLVVGNFYVTGRSLDWAARFGPTALQATALGGFLVRLVLFAAAIVVLRPVDAIDGPVLAISAAVAMVVVLAYEVRLVSSHRELWFVDT